MSRGLNLSGFKLPASNKGYGTGGGVMSGDNKLSYWLRVRELSPYLADHLGKPEIDIKLDKIQMPDLYKKKKKCNFCRMATIKGNEKSNKYY